MEAVVSTVSTHPVEQLWYVRWNTFSIISSKEKKKILFKKIKEENSFIYGSQHH